MLVMLLAGLVALFVLVWPADAHAWGPVTHLVHGTQILSSLSILGSTLQEILRENRFAYLYGCVAADMSIVYARLSGESGGAVTLDSLLSAAHVPVSLIDVAREVKAATSDQLLPIS